MTLSDYTIGLWHYCADCFFNFRPHRMHAVYRSAAYLAHPAFSRCLKSFNDYVRPIISTSTRPISTTSAEMVNFGCGWTMWSYFSIPQGTLLWQPIFVDCVHAMFVTIYLRNGRVYSCYGRRIESRMWSIRWHHFKWPWMTLTAETASAFYYWFEPNYFRSPDLFSPNFHDW